MRIDNKILQSLILLALIGTPLFAQPTEKEKLQAEVDSLSTNLQILRHQQQVLSRKADSLAQDIQSRKQKGPSLLQDRALNTALRFSQTIADSLQKLQEYEHRSDRRLRQKAEELLKILNSEIDRLVKEGESQKRRKNSAQREQVTRELLHYREWQRRCQELLEQPPPPIIIYEVRVQPDDTPEAVRRKADFLRDQADRLHREMKRLEEKIAEIRDETEVRARVAEFAAELSLLDPSREAAPISRANEPSLLGADKVGLESSFRDNQTSRVPVSQSWPTNLGNLSLDELKRWQKNLEQQKRRLQTQADSLKQRAETIESDKAGRP